MSIRPVIFGYESFLQNIPSLWGFLLIIFWNDFENDLFEVTYFEFFLINDNLYVLNPMNSFQLNKQKTKKQI